MIKITYEIEDEKIILLKNNKHIISFNTVSEIDQCIKQLIEAKEKLYGDFHATIMLNIDGPYAKEVGVDFGLWFAEEKISNNFTNYNFNKKIYEYKLTYDNENNEWFIKSKIGG